MATATNSAIARARAAGLSDEDIANYLASKLEPGVVQAREAGIPDKDIVDHLLTRTSLGPAKSDPGARGPLAPMPETPEWLLGPNLAEPGQRMPSRQPRVSAPSPRFAAPTNGQKPFDPYGGYYDPNRGEVPKAPDDYNWTVAESLKSSLGEDFKTPSGGDWWEGIKATMARWVQGADVHRLIDLRDKAMGVTRDWRGEPHYNFTPEQMRDIADSDILAEINDKIAEAKAAGREITAEQQHQGALNSNFWSNVLNTGSQSLVSSAPGFAAGLISKNPALGAAMMYPTTKEGTYGDLIEQGVNPRTADTAATLNAIIEVGTELPALRAATAEGSPILKRFGETVGAEFPGETVAGLSQPVVEKYATAGDKATMLDPLAEGLREGFSQLPETYGSILMTAGAHSLLGHAADAVQQKRREVQEASKEEEARNLADAFREAQAEYAKAKTESFVNPQTPFTLQPPAQTDLAQIMQQMGAPPAERQEPYIGGDISSRVPVDPNAPELPIPDPNIQPELPLDTIAPPASTGSRAPDGGGITAPSPPQGTATPPLSSAFGQPTTAAPPATPAPQRPASATAPQAAPAVSTTQAPAGGAAPTPDANGFIDAPDGYRIRITQHEKGSQLLDPNADIGAFVYEVRKGKGDRSPLQMVVDKSGKLIQRNDVINADNSSNGRAWLPPDQATADKARAILSRRALTKTGSAERKALDAELKDLVTGKPAGPTAPAQAAPSLGDAVTPKPAELPPITKADTADDYSKQAADMEKEGDTEGAANMRRFADEIRKGAGLPLQHAKAPPAPPGKKAKPPSPQADMFAAPAAQLPPPPATKQKPADWVAAQVDTDRAAAEKALAEHQQPFGKDIDAALAAVHGAKDFNKYATAVADLRRLLDKAAKPAAEEAPPHTVQPYSSGMSHRADLRTNIESRVGIGATITQLSNPGIEDVADAIAAGKEAFVDSGAFSAFMAAKRAGHERPEIEDYDEVIKRYNKLVKAVADRLDAQKGDIIDRSFKRQSLMLVAPDSVGRQDVSLKLIEKHAEEIGAWIDAGHEVVIPFQKGKIKQSEYYRRVEKLLGTPLFVVGVPSNAEAMSDADFRELLTAKPHRIHILGAINSAVLPERMKAVNEADPGREIGVTADATLLRAELNKRLKGLKGKARAEMLEKILEENVSEYPSPRVKLPPVEKKGKKAKAEPEAAPAPKPEAPAQVAPKAEPKPKQPAKADSIEVPPPPEPRQKGTKRAPKLLKQMADERARVDELIPQYERIKAKLAKDHEYLAEKTERQIEEELGYMRAPGDFNHYLTSLHGLAQTLEVAINRVEPKKVPLDREATYPKPEGPVREVVDDDEAAAEGESLLLGTTKAKFGEVINEHADLFADPEAKVLATQHPENEKPLTRLEADQRIQGWMDHAFAQTLDEDKHHRNMDRAVISLFDLTGAWSQPYMDAGYNVIHVDLQNGHDIRDFSVEYIQENWPDVVDVYAILIAAPCTHFSGSGAHAWEKKDADGQTEEGKELVMQALRTVEYFRPQVWALENPTGRIEELTGLPKARYSFQPHNFGDPYTKKTHLWGKFATDLPVAPVEPTEGSKIHSDFGGKSIETKNARSATPDGFAYAFFMANNAEDATPQERLVGEFPMAAGAIEVAIEKGFSEAQIRKAINDGNYDPGSGDAPEARKELKKLVKTGKPEPEPKPKVARPPTVAALAKKYGKIPEELFQRASDKGLNLGAIDFYLRHQDTDERTVKEFEQYVLGVEMTKPGNYPYLPDPPRWPKKTPGRPSAKAIAQMKEDYGKSIGRLLPEWSWRKDAYLAEGSPQAKQFAKTIDAQVEAVRAAEAIDRENGVERYTKYTEAIAELRATLEKAVPASRKVKATDEPTPPEETPPAEEAPAPDEEVTTLDEDVGTKAAEKKPKKAAAKAGREAGMDEGTEAAAGTEASSRTRRADERIVTPSTVRENLMNELNIDAAEFRNAGGKKQWDIVSKAIADKYGFAQVNIADRQNWRPAVDHLLDAFESLQNMAMAMGQGNKIVSLNGKGSLNMREKARGKTQAYFQHKGGLTGDPDNQISIFNRADFYSHEFAHLLDYDLMERAGGMEPGGLTRMLRNKEPTAALPGTTKEAFANLLTALYFDAGEIALLIKKVEHQLQKAKTPARQAELQRRLANLKSGAWRGRGSKTEFYKRAQNGAMSEYLTKPTELFARAFEAYMSWKIQEQHAMGLVKFIGATDSIYRDTADAWIARTYPQAVDRQNIFSAFDNLLGQIARENIYNVTAATPGYANSQLNLGLMDPVAQAKAAGLPITPEIVRGKNLTNAAAQTYLKDEAARQDKFFKNLARLGRDVAKGVPGAPDAMRAFMKSWSGTPDSLFAFLERRFPEILGLRTIRDTFSDAQIHGRNKPVGLYRQIQQKENSLVNRIEDKMNAVGIIRNMDAAEAEHLWDVVTGNAQPKNEAVRRQADQIRYELDYMWGVRDQTGESIGYIDEPYQSRVFQQRIADSEKFHADILKLRHAEKAALIKTLTQQLAQAVKDSPLAKTLTARLKAAEKLDPDAATVSQVAAMKGLKWGAPIHLGALSSDSAKERVFGPMADVMLKDWYVKDPMTLLAGYASSAARGIVMRQRLGPNPEKTIQEMLNSVALKLPSVYAGVLKNAMEVSLGTRKGDNGIIAQAMNAYANVNNAHMLGRSVLPNISEVLNVISKSNSPLSTFGELMKAMMPIMRSQSRKERYAIADRFGRLSGTLVHAASSTTAMAQAIGEDVNGNGLLARFSMRAFYFNLLAGLTAWQEKVTNRVGFEIFYEAARMVRAGGKDAGLYKQWLREHGIRDADAFAAFLQDHKTVDSVQFEDTLLPGVGQTLANALDHFVHTTIQKPTPSTKLIQAHNGAIGVMFRLTSWMTTNFTNWAVHLKDKALTGVSGRYGGDILTLAQRFKADYKGQKLTIPQRLHGRVGGTQITTYQRFHAMAYPVAASLVTMYMAQAAFVVARMMLTNGDEWKDRGDDFWDRFKSLKTQAQIFQYWGVLGWLANTAIDVTQGTRHNRGVVGTLLGPAYGGMVQDAERFLKYFSDNSPNTNTAENNAAQSSWHIVSLLATIGIISTMPISGKAGAVGRVAGFLWSFLGTSPQASHEVADFFTGEKTAALQKKAAQGDAEARHELGRRDRENAKRARATEKTNRGNRGHYQ